MVDGLAGRSLTRTCPPRHAAAASGRVFVSRTAHNHRSTRVDSTTFIMDCRRRRRTRAIEVRAAVGRRCDCRHGAVRRYRRSGNPSERTTDMVPRGSTGADRKHQVQPGDLGKQRLPQLLHRLPRPGQRGPKNLGRTESAEAASSRAEFHSADSAEVVLGPLSSVAVPVSLTTTSVETQRLPATEIRRPTAMSSRPWGRVVIRVGGVRGPACRLVPLGEPPPNA